MNSQNNLIFILSNKILVGLTLLFVCCNLAASEIVYIGMPHTRISVDDYGQAVSNKLSKTEAEKYKIILINKNKTLLWKTRQDNRLCGKLSGAFYTFTSINGNGYIRLISEKIRAGIDKLGDKGKSMSGYTEVIYNSVGMIIYQGYTVKDNLDASPVFMKCTVDNPLERFNVLE